MISIVFCLLAVAFITLLERKLLGLSQTRLGPNKTSAYGMLQPIRDGLKLLSKFNLFIIERQVILQVVSPALLLIILLLVWSWLVSWEGRRTFKLSSLRVVLLLGASTYLVILIGWRGSRSFSKLGGIRSILQRLSFEVSLIVTLLVLITFFKQLSLRATFKPLRLEIFWIWCRLWSIVCLLERNRAPFDLLEGESELIRGFNIEMRSLLFVFLFLREYGFILALIRLVFIRGFKRPILSILVLRLLLFLRRCYPRVRFDVVMTIRWQRILPIILIYYTLTIFFL